VIIEWADRVAGALPEDRLNIRIEPMGDTLRKMSLEPVGASAARLARVLQ
jgi:tRNA A37 threonylcarbamoyladenosine biosynthesis protein TsaE